MYVWLVCENHAKILLSDPETSLMTLCLLSLRQSPGRSHGNHQSSQLSGSSRNVLKRLGRSGRSRGNQALHCIYLPPHNKHLEISIFKLIAAEFHLQLCTNIKSKGRRSKVIQVNQIKRRCMYTSDLAYRKLLAN